MAKEYSERKHGDGKLGIKVDFFTLTEEESENYAGILSEILIRTGIKIEVDYNYHDALLALKQRLEIAFSNGCPWPEKAIVEDLVEHRPQSMTEVARIIREGAAFDGKRSFLFQMLLKSASTDLHDELLSYHPWEDLSRQENRNLPSDITSPEGRGGYGLAFNPLYFDAIVPLYEFIESGPKAAYSQRYLSVIEFFETRLGSVDSTDRLVEVVKQYLKERLFEYVDSLSDEEFIKMATELQYAGRYFAMARNQANQVIFWGLERIHTTGHEDDELFYAESHFDKFSQQVLHSDLYEAVRKRLRRTTDQKIEDDWAGWLIFSTRKEFDQLLETMKGLVQTRYPVQGMIRFEHLPDYKAQLGKYQIEETFIVKTEDLNLNQAFMHRWFPNK